MKRRIVLCLLVLALLSVAGCAQKKDAEPLTVTLWHVYGGEVDSPLNGLIERFNSTVGAKQNIRVKVELVSNSGSIHKSVLAAANSDPGAPSLPDMILSQDGAGSAGSEHIGGLSGLFQRGGAGGVYPCLS